MSLRNLPPLDLLEPFEAAARHGSFTRAADELSVTQSAISQRVRKLEELLGIKLFERLHRSIELTPEGRELLNGVTVALRHLTSATHSLRQRGGQPRLKLGVDTSIAQLWLMPRLKRILSHDPSIVFDLTVSDCEKEVLNSDVAILHGDGLWPGYVARLLFKDEIFPVCSPGYLQRRPISRAQDLLGADLIDLDYIHWNWINWNIWFTESRLEQADARILLRTNSYTTQLDAARAGLGVALGWGHLLDEDLRNGTLIRPIQDSVDTKYGYYVLHREGADSAAHHVSQHLMHSRQSSGLSGFG
ncbi:MAG: LysR substrate-binding domain-containing protein [Albidovulum sp.]